MTAIVMPTSERYRETGRMEPVRIGATGAAMTGAAVIAWVKAAARGRELVYATGSLPGWSGVGAVVRDLDERGIVFAFYQRGDYVIRRLDKPWTPPPAPVRIGRKTEPTTDDKARLLRVIRAEAKAGQPLSSNHVLAIKAGLSDRNRASYLLKLLVADGAIRREDSEWWPGRQAIDLATGNATFVQTGEPWPVAGKGARHPMGGGR